MFTPATLEFVMVSFEGPDQYSLAGGLGVRAKELTKALSDSGFTTTLAFAGDPDQPPRETRDGVKLIRWAQSISAQYRAGVYEGEREKILDLGQTFSEVLINEVIRPAVAMGRAVAILCEEWQTADFCQRLHFRLEQLGIRSNCLLLWNANNWFGFNEIDWKLLSDSAALTTVSRYMKQMMLPYGVNPVVIPNGIPNIALVANKPDDVKAIRAAACTPCLAFKMGRFTPDKRWEQAVDAVAELRNDGMPARLLMRGGIEAHGSDVFERARVRGLEVYDWNEPIVDSNGVVQALSESNNAAVVNIGRFMPDTVLPAIQQAATAVLANSGHEPFGLVGLETMAAGGVAIVGATGEDYARPYGNAIVIETADPSEVASALRGLVERPHLAERLRVAGKRDARDFTWPAVMEGLIERLRYIGARQGLLMPNGDGVKERM